MKVFLFISIMFLNVFALGIQGQKAPEFGVDTWVQTNGKRNISIEDYKGKVLYIYGFQSWCPGCHSHGFPTLNKLSNHYKNDKDVAFIAIQTAFEGHYINTTGAAKLIIKKYDLTMPVGHSGRSNKNPEFMSSYKTGGTPWTVIVDKAGVVRFNNFHAQEDKLIEFIDVLKKEKVSY